MRIDRGKDGRASGRALRAPSVRRWTHDGEPLPAEDGAIVDIDKHGNVALVSEGEPRFDADTIGGEDFTASPLLPDPVWAPATQPESQPEPRFAEPEFAPLVDDYTDRNAKRSKR